MSKKIKDKKISIYQNYEGTDSAGFPVSGVKLVALEVWAYTRQLSAKEYYASAQVQVDEDRLFTINWRDDIQVMDIKDLYIFYKDLWYKVTRIDTYEDYKKDIQVYATAGVTEAPGTIIS